MPFDKLSLKELKEHAKQHKEVIKGYTKMGKEDLVKVMKKHLKMDRKGEVTRKSVEGGAIAMPAKKPPLVKVKPVIPVEAPIRRSEPIPPRRPIIHYEGRPLTEHERQQRARFGLGLDRGTRIKHLRERIDKLKGGQLPSDVRKKLEDLELKLKSKE